MKNFWKFQDSLDAKGADLYLEGDISSQTWWGDEVTPEVFRSELKAQKGNITVHINSPGGDVFAGVDIYNALKDYKNKVIVKVDGLAASIASIIAMAGDEIIMSPGSMMMIHNPWSGGMGSSDELRKAADLLDEIKSSIVPIYAERTGLDETEIEDMMDAETWLSAEKAVEKGFADSVARKEKKEDKAVKNLAFSNFAFSMSATKSAMSDFITKFNNSERTDIVNEDDKKPAEEVEAPKDVILETPSTTEEAETEAAEEAVEEAVETKAEEVATEEAVEEEKEEVEEAPAEEAEEPKEEEGQGEEVADKLETLIKDLKAENAELKAKLEEATAANDKAKAALKNNDALQARYAAILNMAVEADGGETENEKEETPVDSYEKTLEDAFKAL